MVWCDVMWCDVMWCDVMWCDVMWCDVMWCDVMWCDAMWYDLMRCDQPFASRRIPSKKRTDDNASQKSSYQGECLANSCKLSSVAANGDRHNIMASAPVGLKKLKLMYAVGSDRYGFTSSGTSNRCWTYRTNNILLHRIYPNITGSLPYWHGLV